ncbi:MAG: YdcF family protein [Flavobacteriales bacterium]|nr:YdcF family protein [Flavobacteriales bacterium]
MALGKGIARNAVLAFGLLYRMLRRPLRAVIFTLGASALMMIMLAFTRVPFDLHRWLGTAAGGMDRAAEAELIVVLGGSGMPSGPELLRLHHAAALAENTPGAVVVVMHPHDTAVMDAMLGELSLRGVDNGRMTPLLDGANTREQALALRAAMPGTMARRIALVTAPENCYRSVRAFRRAGFANVKGEPAWDTPMFIDLDYDHRRVGGKPYVPDVSASAALRYDFWNRLKLEITCLREFVAIGYYRLNGWI